MPTAPSAANRPYGDEPPLRDGADACPGALRLHSANDGALARVRIPAGLLTAAQADVLASAAERLGDARLDLTSRGNVQLRGLEPACAGELARLLGAAGLLPAPRHERVRNIVASPLSGLDGQGAYDVLPWVRELDALLCASETATALSGRFLFACDDGRGDMTALDADVTILAFNAGGQPPAWARPAPRTAATPRSGTPAGRRPHTPQKGDHTAVPPGPPGPPGPSGDGPASVSPGPAGPPIGDGLAAVVPLAADGARHVAVSFGASGVSAGVRQAAVSPVGGAAADARGEAGGIRAAGAPEMSGPGIGDGVAAVAPLAAGGAHQAAGLPGRAGASSGVGPASAPPVGGVSADADGEAGCAQAHGIGMPAEGQAEVLPEMSGLPIGDGPAAVAPLAAQEAHYAAVPPGASGTSSDGGATGADAPAQGAAHRSRPDARSALLRIAGDSGAYCIAARHAARAALVVAEAFVELAGGQAWRVRELPAGKSLPPGGLVPLLAGHGIEARYESDAPAPDAPAPVPGPVGGPNGRTALSVAAPLGRLTAAQWRQLAAVAREDGDGTLRLTPWRGIVLPGLTPAAAPARLAALADAGLIAAPDDPRTGVSACTGRPGCAKSLADVRADAAAATASGGGGLPVHLSGCERRCGHPRGRWTDVLATPDGYRIAAPGKPVHHGVTPAELAGALAAARTTPATR